MTWWQKAWPRRRRTTSVDGARPSTDAACSHQTFQADAEQIEEVQKSANSGVLCFSREDLLSTKTPVPPRQQQPQQLQMLHDLIRCLQSVLAYTDDTAMMDGETLHHIYRRNAGIKYHSGGISSFRTTCRAPRLYRVH